jgi:hypothetical protein
LLAEGVLLRSHRLWRAFVFISGYARPKGKRSKKTKQGVFASPSAKRSKQAEGGKKPSAQRCEAKKQSKHAALPAFFAY